MSQLLHECGARLLVLLSRPAHSCGRRAREVYGAEDVHDFARRAILLALAPGPGDRVLEWDAAAACCSAMS